MTSTMAGAMAGVSVPAACLVASAAAAAATDAGHAGNAGSGTIAQRDPAQRDRYRYDVRATRLIDSEVRNKADEELGKVSDLVIDLGRYEVRYGIVDSGGVLGYGGKLFAFPLRFFGVAQQTDRVVLDIDAEKLKAAPGFARNTMPDWGNFPGSVDRYFGISEPAPTAQSRNLTLFSRIAGARGNVVDKTGARAGRIVDMVFNRNNGQIEYMVLELDTAWSRDSMLLPLPIQAFYFGHSGGRPVLDISLKRLDMSFAFAPDKWPEINDPGYQGRIGRYLGLVTQDNPSPTPPNSDAAEGAGQVR